MIYLRGNSDKKNEYVPFDIEKDHVLNIITKIDPALFQHPLTPEQIDSIDAVIPPKKDNPKSPTCIIT
jgi:hypothetical protein